MLLKRSLRRLAAFAVLAAVLVASVSCGAREARRSGAEPRPTVILDAGHGGEDSGTVGVNGVPEKELNLSIAFLLRDLLSLAGIEVVLTRTDDRLLYTEEQNIRGRRKMYDLLNRRLTAEQYPDALFISIHMNAYPDEDCSGFQAWCADDGESRRLAECMRESVRERLQPGNARGVKTAGSNIYLLHHAIGTAVLLECGFLSNREECERLSDEDYRRELSFSLFCGIINYLNADPRA